MKSLRRSQRRQARKLSLEQFERRDLLATLELVPVADNTLFEDASGNLSNGAGDHFFAGRVASSGGGDIRRGLLRFDLMDLPANASIRSVSVELNMSRTVAGMEAVSLHTVLAGWGEGASHAAGAEGMGAAAQINDATWKHRSFPGTDWASLGGDFVPAASATTQVGGSGKYVWTSEQLATDVANWATTSATNFGWIVIGNELTTRTAKRFDTRENSVDANRPKLIIDFDLPDTTSPTPTITGPASPTSSDAFDVTIGFGEPVVGFVADDITVAGGSVTNLVDNGGGNFTASIEATANGEVTVDVAASVATDSAGNANNAAAPFSITVAANLDYGDAPSAAQSGFPNSYPVTLADDGARHSVGALTLGSLIDADVDGLPTADASGDGADDDGVNFVTTLVAAPTSTVSSLSVIASGSGKLDAWVDFNQDGDWGDGGEQILVAATVVAGENVLSFTIPAEAAAGITGARLRLSSAGGLAPTGTAADGEVEDYLVRVLEGDSSPDVTVNLDGDVLALSFESGDIVLRSGQTLRFRAASANVGSLNIVGTASDDTVSLDLGGGFHVPFGGLELVGGSGDNTLLIVGPDGSLDLTNPAIDASDLGVIDLSSVDKTALTLDASVVASLAPATRLIEIVAAEGDEITVREASAWRMTDPVIVDGQFHVTATHQEGGQEKIQARVPRAWQNLLNPSDVSNNGSVTSVDALVIINELGRQRFKQPSGQDLLDPIDVPIWPGLYFDQNGDNRATALDALRVINELAAQTLSGESSEFVLSPFTRLPSDSPQAAEASTPGDEPTLLSRDRTKPVSATSPGWQPPSVITAIHARPEVSSGDMLSIHNVDQLLSDDSFISDRRVHSGFSSE